LTSRKIALDYLGKVEARLKALRLFFDDRRYDDVIREAHEALELILKGSLRFIGIDPPKRHDPSDVLLRHLDRLPAGWRDRASRLQELSHRLFAERGLAFYGDEDDLAPPSELFDRSDAEEAICGVEEFLDLYRAMVLPGE